MPPPRVYITVSRSGLMCKPNRMMSSPVLPITVISASGAAALRPRRKRAAPTPPARTVMRIQEVLQPHAAPVIPSPRQHPSRLPPALSSTPRIRPPRTTSSRPPDQPFPPSPTPPPPPPPGSHPPPAPPPPHCHMVRGCVLSYNGV